MNIEFRPDKNHAYINESNVIHMVLYDAQI